MVRSGVTLAEWQVMRRHVVVLVFLLAGCKSMSGFGSGLGHVASGFGHVASGFGHVAGAAASVAGHAANGIARIAPSAATVGNVVNATAKVAEVAVDVAELAAENAVIEGLDEDVAQPMPPDDDNHVPTGDLCLDCPDAGNCNSCQEPR